MSKRSGRSISFAQNRPRTTVVIRGNGQSVAKLGRGMATRGRGKREMDMELAGKDAAICCCYRSLP